MATNRIVHETMVEQLMIRNAMLVWQPLALCADWWALAGGDAVRPAHVRRESRAQLVVPEPLERTGEHALFA